eukprot:IDg9237t1
MEHTPVSQHQIDSRAAKGVQLEDLDQLSNKNRPMASLKDPRSGLRVDPDAARDIHGHGAKGAEQPPDVGGNGKAGRDENYETAGQQQSRDHKPPAYQGVRDSGAGTTTGEQRTMPNLVPQTVSQLHAAVVHRGNKAESHPGPPGPPPPSTNTNTPPAMPASAPTAGSKIFVGGLSWETDEGSLRRYFETFGEVLDCVIMRDRHTGHPRGFGFVTFADDAVAGSAASRRHDLDGRQVEAKRAVPRNEFGGGMGGHQAPQSHHNSGAMGSSNHGYGSRSGVQNYRAGTDGTGYGGMSQGSGGGGGMRNHHTTKCKVFVGGLPSSCGSEEFRNYFQTFGEVVDAQVMIDHNTGNSRGFGFVTFASEATVEQVVGPGRSNTRHEIMGKNVEVKRAEPKGANSERRHRDNYGAGGGVGANVRGTGGGNSSNIGGNSDAGGNAATAAAAAYYNYPGASLAEQYGAYYNNPQWQQYYAAMGYNFNAYPQGYNPYSGVGSAPAAAVGGGGGGVGGVGGDIGGAVPPAGGDAQGYDAAGGAAVRGGRYGSDRDASGVGGNASLGAGGVAGGPSGSGGARRTSRRDERYHPYR